MRNINLDVFTFSFFVSFFSKDFIMESILIKFLFYFKKSLLYFCFYFWSQLAFSKIHFHVLTFEIFKELIIWAISRLSHCCSHGIHIKILVHGRINLMILTILPFYYILIYWLFALLNKKFRWIIITNAGSSNNWELLIHENIILLAIAPLLTQNIANILKWILIAIRDTLIKPRLHMIIRNLLLVILILKASSFQPKSILSSLTNDRQISLWQVLNLLIIKFNIALSCSSLIHIIRNTWKLSGRNFSPLIQALPWIRIHFLWICIPLIFQTYPLYAIIFLDYHIRLLLKFLTFSPTNTNLAIISWIVNMFFLFLFCRFLLYCD